MRKIVSSIVVILSVCMISSCNSNGIKEITTNASDTMTNTTVVETENNTLNVESAKVSDSALTNNDIETSYDFNYLNQIGVYQLIENDIIWKTYFYGEYSFKHDYMPKTAEIDNETYVELSIATRNDICDNLEYIQKAFGIELNLSDDKTFYLCPFDSIQDLKNQLKRTYTESYINYFLSYMTIIEYDNSLYIPDSGGVYPSREVISATIIEESDTNITFSIEYNLLPIDDVNLNVNYSAVYKNGKWLLDSINNV